MVSFGVVVVWWRLPAVRFADFPLTAELDLGWNGSMFT